MSQPIETVGIQLNLSLPQCLFGVAFTAIVFKSDIAKHAGWGVVQVTTWQFSGLIAIIQNFSEIVITSGVSLVANQLINTLCPALSASALPAFEGSIKVAKFVAAFFTLKAHLSPFIETAFRFLPMNPIIDLEQQAVQYLCPLTISLFAAHYFNLQIKLAQSAALAGGTFLLIKVLAKGLQNMRRSHSNSSLNNRQTSSNIQLPNGSLNNGRVPSNIQLPEGNKTDDESDSD